MERVGFEPTKFKTINLQLITFDRSVIFPDEIGVVRLELTIFYTQSKRITNYATLRKKIIILKELFPKD